MKCQREHDKVFDVVVFVEKNANGSDDIVLTHKMEISSDDT